VGYFHNDDDDEDDDDGDNDEGDHRRWQQIRQWRNDDGNDLGFLGNNQPWLDAFVGEGGLGDFYDDDDDENDDDGDNNEGDHRQWQRLGQRRNDDGDGDDLVFLGNNQPWSDAFLAEGWLGDFYDDDDDKDDKDDDNEGDHRRWQRIGRRRNDNGDDLVFLGNNQPWSDAFLAEGGWVISTMKTTMWMTTMATTMRETVANDNE